MVRGSCVAARRRKPYNPFGEPGWRVPSQAPAEPRRRETASSQRSRLVAAMGAYLSKPVTEKKSMDCSCDDLTYGLSEMQVRRDGTSALDRRVSPAALPRASVSLTAVGGPNPTAPPHPSWVLTFCVDKRRAGGGPWRTRTSRNTRCPAGWLCSPYSTATAALRCEQLFLSPPRLGHPCCTHVLPRLLDHGPEWVLAFHNNSMRGMHARQVSKFCAKYMPGVIRQMPAFAHGDHGAALTQVFHKMDDMLRDDKFYAEVQACVSRPPCSVTQGLVR